MNPYRFKAYLYLLAVVVIWGSAGPIIKFTLAGIDPLPFLAYRLLISAVISLIFFLVKIRNGKKFRRFKANFPIVLLYGLLAIPLALGILFIGLDKTTVLDLALIGVIGPMVVTAGGAIFYHDRITRKEKIGIAIVLVGVFLNSIYPIFKAGSSIRLTGNLLLLIYLFADAGSVLIAKKAVRKNVKSSNLTNMAFIIGAIVILPLTLTLYGAGNLLNMIVTLPLKYHLGVWYMAVFSGTLAYYFYVRGQRTIEVSEATLFNYLQSVFTIPLAIFWLKEIPGATFFIGAFIIALGVIIAEQKNKRKTQPSNQITN